MTEKIQIQKNGRNGWYRVIVNVTDQHSMGVIIQNKEARQFMNELRDVLNEPVEGNIEEDEVIIKYIPKIKTLKLLKCEMCFRITKIPKIKGLKMITIDECKNMKHVPKINGLNTILIDSCKFLKYIPKMNNLKYIKITCCPFIYIENTNTGVLFSWKLKKLKLHCIKIGYTLLTRNIQQYIVNIY